MQLLFSLDDLKEALRRRGPDSLGAKKVFLQRSVSGESQISSFAEHDEILCSGNKDSSGELHFIGSTLQLRGTIPLVQPLVDAFGNVLVYNGNVCYCLEVLFLL